MNVSDIDQLQALFANETSLMRDFVAVLQEEADILATPAVGAALDATTRRKTELAQELSHAAEQRHACYVRLGYPGMETDHSDLRRDHPHLAPSIDALAQVMAQARTLNEQNGLIIEAYLKYNQQALEDLRLISGQHLSLYDASGRTHQRTASSTRIKAG